LPSSAGCCLPLQTFGVFGYAFCDFGDEFVCVDVNGEEPVSSMIATVDNSTFPAVVTCLDDARHGLEDGDYVEFREVGGMDALNEAAARPVKVLGPYTFSVEGLEAMGAHTQGGIVTQVKQKKVLAFKSLREAIADPDGAFSAPDMGMTDFGKFDRPKQIHFGVQALHRYAAESGSLPPPSDAAAAAAVTGLAKQLASEAKAEVDFSDRLMANLASGSRGELSPLCAFFGGIVGQEVMKAASGKFHPLKQWLYFDAEEALPGNGEVLLPPVCAAPRHPPSIRPRFALDSPSIRP
jgi:ubiquitin-activating enzyme E1